MSSCEYTPGTMLSYANGNECCTVLTNGGCLVTKIEGELLEPDAHIVPLAYWLSRANGYVKDTPPLPEQCFSSDTSPVVSLEIGRKSKFTEDEQAFIQKQDASEFSVYLKAVSATWPNLRYLHARKKASKLWKARKEWLKHLEPTPHTLSSNSGILHALSNVS